MNQCLKKLFSSSACKGSESVIPLQEEPRAVMVEPGVTNERVMLHKIELGLRQRCEHNRNVVATVQVAEFGHLPFIIIRRIWRRLSNAHLGVMVSEEKINNWNGSLILTHASFRCLSVKVYNAIYSLYYSRHCSSIRTIFQISKTVLQDALV